MSATLELAQDLMRRKSVTPDDAGCQDVLAARLERLGFRIERLRFGQTDNLWARRGDTGPLFCYAGHTDVVPPGPQDKWTSDPFTPTIRDGVLYGRGASDMKTSIAAMVVATEQFLAATPAPKGSIAFLITSDEEGDAHDGTKRVISTLEARKEKIDYCLVGESSSEKILGDIVRNGRRGSLTGKLTIRGKQGHVAYPHLADNPIHKAAPFLQAFTSVEWDKGNEFFPPTSFQVVEIKAGTGTNNMVPGDVFLMFNWRFSTGSTVESLQQRTEDLLAKHGITDYELTWHLSGNPFLTRQGKLIDVVRSAIKEVSGIEPQLNTGGGTSDGRFISPTGAEVVEVGPNNASIHKIDECIALDELEKLTALYQAVLAKLLG